MNATMTIHTPPVHETQLDELIKVLSEEEIRETKEFHTNISRALRSAVACGLRLMEAKRHFSATGKRYNQKKRFKKWLDEHFAELPLAIVEQYIQYARDMCSATQTPSSRELVEILAHPDTETDDLYLNKAIERIVDIIRGQKTFVVGFKIIKEANIANADEFVFKPITKATRRQLICEKLVEELQFYMLKDLCWADQDTKLIEKMLKLMMKINTLLRETLKARNENKDADIFIQPLAFKK